MVRTRYLDNEQGYDYMYKRSHILLAGAIESAP